MNKCKECGWFLSRPKVKVCNYPDNYYIDPTGKRAKKLAPMVSIRDNAKCDCEYFMKKERMKKQLKPLERPEK